MKRPPIMILVLVLFVGARGILGSYTPKDHYLLMCGPHSSSSVGSFDSLTWSDDENQTFSSSFSSTVSVSAVLTSQDGAQLIPFTGARIFNSSFSYTFPVSPGPKFLRLFFLPTVYSGGYDTSQFYVTVQANDHLLLRNFSALLAVNYATFTFWDNTHQPDPYVIKEYYLTIPDDQSSLNLTFSPTPPSSHAFVNGIELVSVPDNLYISNKTIQDLDLYNSDFVIQNTTALETAYRLNVGGSDVVGPIDEGLMDWLWKSDDPYMLAFYGQPAETKYHSINYTESVPEYTAPAKVYKTERHFGSDYATNMKHNLTWRFKVDPEFNYMVRLHWCELDLHINKTGDRVFEVYINSVTAEQEADVLSWTGDQRFVPVYRDYVLFVEGGDGGGGSADLWIALHPSIQDQQHTRYNEALLNGLEIFKLSRPDDGSLCAPNPHVSLGESSSQQHPQHTTGRHRKQSRLHGLLAIIIVTVILVISLLACVFRLKLVKKASKSRGSENGSTLPSHLCRRFTLAEIKSATHDFSEALVVGHGGFGFVYKGKVDGENEVAIKRLSASSKQGAREFSTEIKLLSKLRHIHLVSLIGFCDEGNEMILVYEYMKHGTLRDHLYKTTNSPLSWNQRLKACLGAAKGLHYLHLGATPSIIHRDVKSTNILLDRKWVSKVSDFGISKLGPQGEQDLISHVSTAVKGSIGYLDLEYYNTQRLTQKSDVYSFGVVLLEVLCGRPAVDPTLPREQISLAIWGQTHIRNGTLELIVDPNIKEEIAPACLARFGEIAESCLRDQGSDRPSMSDLVWSLEFVIALQEKDDNGTATEATNISSNTSSYSGNFSYTSVDGFERIITSDSSALMTSSSEDYGQFTSGSVFSEILRPKGR